MDNVKISSVCLFDISTDFPEGVEGPQYRCDLGHVMPTIGIRVRKGNKVVSEHCYGCLLDFINKIPACTKVEE